MSIVSLIDTPERRGTTALDLRQRITVLTIP